MADVDHEPGGQGLNRKSSTFFEADKVRQRDGLVFIKERVFSVGLQADAGHTHSRLKRFHLRSYLIDYTRGLHAGRIGQFGPDEVGALAKEVIREIYPDGMIPHPHHSGAQFRFWNVNNLHDIGTANFVELNCLHALVTSGFRYTSQSVAEGAALHLSVSCQPRMAKSFRTVQPAWSDRGAAAGLALR